MDRAETVQGGSPAEPSVVDKIDAHGWRQGCILPSSLFEQIEGTADWVPDPSKDVVVVLTGDCNLLHRQLEHEPVVDVVGGQILAAMNGNYTNRKNPRVLHVTAETANGPTVLEFVAWRRGTVRRSALADAAPSQDVALAPLTRRTLVDWWAVGRFQRPSFPDEFNKRLRAAEGKRRIIEKLLTEVRDEVLAVYVNVQPDRELSVDELYEVWLRVVVTKQVSDDPALWAQIEEKFYEPFLDRLKSARGIKIVNDLLVSEEDFSLRELRLMARLEYDYLSYAGEEDDNGAGPLPPRA